jgi:hypothetical protein
MRNTHSRRDLLKGSSALAAATVFAEPLRAAAPEPSEITPALIEAARKEGKVSFYTALELPVAERFGKVFEAKYPGIAVRVERSGAERIYQRIAQEQGAASTRSTSPTAPTRRIISTGNATAGSRPMCRRTWPGISRPSSAIPTACMRPCAPG